MRLLILLAVITADSLLAGAVHSAEGEATQIAEYCRIAIGVANVSNPTVYSADEALHIGFCLGLMDGLRGANYFLKKADPSSAFCEPATFDNVDLAKAFVSSVAEIPSLTGLRGTLAAQIALSAAYPCKEGK